MMKLNNSNDAAVAHELLGKVLTGQAPDDEFIDHLWRVYDPQILSEIFRRVKSLADASYKSQDYSKAIDYYTSCILLVKNAAERSKLYSNRSISFFKNRQYAEAYSDGLKCIALTPKWAKAWFRAGCALLQIEKYELALTCLNTSLKYADDEEQRHGIQSEIKSTEAKLESSKRKRRYQTDYNRFDKLAQIIASEEAHQKAASESSNLEFNDNLLNEEQKNYLRSQITGEPVKSSSAAQPTTTLRNSKICLDWRYRKTRSAQDSRAALILKEFLLLQSYTSWPGRFFGLLETGITKIFVDKLRIKLNNFSSEQRSVKMICLGTGSIFCPLALSSRTQEILYITDSAMQIDLITTLSSGESSATGDEAGSRCPAAMTFISSAKALDELAKEQKSIAVSLGLRRPARSAAHFSNEEERVDLDDLQEKNKGDLNLRELGERIVQKSIANSHTRIHGSHPPPVLTRLISSTSSMIVIDPDWICPYLLGPNNPTKFLKNWREHSLLLPTRITLNVAIANIQRFSADVEDALYYSVLPMPLPTSYAPHCQILDDFVAAWTLHKFSEIPKGDNPSDNIITIDACKTTTKKHSKFNAIIFSLSFFDGEELFMDTWELYQDCAERGISMKSLAPHFYWVHEDVGGNQGSEPSLSTSNTNLPKTSPPRLRSHEFISMATPEPSNSAPKSSVGHRRSFSSSSSSSADLRNNWVAEIKRGMLLSGARENKRSARSQLASRFGDNVTHKICLQLVNGCISGANVISEDVVCTSSENLVVSNNLNGLNWYESELLDGPPVTPSQPIVNSILLTPKASSLVPHPSVPQGKGGYSSVNDVWVEGLLRVREKKCSEISTRQRRIRAHMIGATNKRLFMRSLVMNISRPALIYDLTLKLIKRGSDHLADNIIDIHCGLDVFCESQSSLRVARAMFKNPSKLIHLREQLMNVRKYKTSVEWRVGNTSVTSSAPLSTSQHTLLTSPCTSLSSIPSLTSDDQVCKDVTKFLFDDKYLILKHAVDVSQLRPSKDSIDREECLRALGMLYNCPPQTPGIDSMEGLIECKQRYDIVIYETPESLSQLVDWVNGGYLRRLLYAKQALAERTAYFYPRRLTLQAFLAYIPNGSEELFPGCTGAKAEPITALRSIETIFNFDGITSARKMSAVITILQVDLNTGLIPNDLLAEKILTFKDDKSNGSNLPAPTIRVLGTDSAAPAEEVDDKDGGLVNLTGDSQTEATSIDDQASESSQAMLHEINLEESTSLLRATSTAMDYNFKEEALTEEDTRAPIEKYVISSQEFLSARKYTSEHSERVSAAGDSQVEANAIVTYAEYGFETFRLSHAPKFCSELNVFPNPKQRYHRLPIPVPASTVSADGVRVRWNIKSQGDDYEFTILSDDRINSPDVSQRTILQTSRIEECLRQVNARQGEIAMNLSHLMGISPEATSQLQEAALMLSTDDEIKSPEAINSIIFSSLN